MEKYNRSRILVTGSAGMIGSNFCHWLLANTEADIIGIDDLSGGYESNMPDDTRFRFIKANVCDEYMDNIFGMYKPDMVYHAAAYAAENLSPFIRKFNYTNNLVGTANIINACINHNVGRLIFFSSIAVYGNGIPPFKETDAPNPNDPYGNAKYACEVDIRIAGEQHGLDWCIVRPYNVYGERQNIKDKYRNVLGIFMNQYLNDRPLTIFGDGTQVRSFTNVKDIMMPLYVAGVSPDASKKIFNLGSEIQYEVKQAAEMLMEIMCGGAIKHLESRHEVHTAYADNTFAKQILGFKNSRFYDGLKEMYDYVVRNPVKGETSAPEYEVTKGMYDAWKK
jgi:UDP-glucose 4-epimerase